MSPDKATGEGLEDKGRHRLFVVEVLVVVATVEGEVVLALALELVALLRVSSGI